MDHSLLTVKDRLELKSRPSVPDKWTFECRGRRRRIAEAVRRVRFGLVILDEAHACKNPESVTSMLVRGLRKDMLLAMTATPLKNHVRDVMGYLRLF